MNIKSVKVQDQTQCLANYVRNDKFHLAKQIGASRFRKMLAGLAVEVGVAEGVLDRIQINYDINQTIDLISEWESALGIPDDCFTTTRTIEERRRNVLTKLTALGVSTADDFIELAETFGLTATVAPGIDELTFPLPFPCSLNARTARWVLVIKIQASGLSGVFPYSFPFILGRGESLRIITCLFQKLVPSNVYVIFKTV